MTLQFAQRRPQEKHSTAAGLFFVDVVEDRADGVAGCARAVGGLPFAQARSGWRFLDTP